MKYLHITVAALTLAALPLTAGATVRKEGAWPATEKKVDLEFDGKPSAGLHKLAEEAGWSLVVSKEIQIDEHEVKINVDDQPADAVLEALFIDANVVARRTGTLITVTPARGGTPAPDLATAPTAPAASTPPTALAPSAASGASPNAAPVPTVRGEDRSVLGSSLVLGKDEIVHTLTVTGGSARILGTVTGDLVVAGGAAKIADGGRVVGNVTVFGGSLKVERGGRIDGDVGIVGGALKREEGSIVGGKVVDRNEQHGRVETERSSEGDVEIEESTGKDASGRSTLGDIAHDLGRSLTNMSLLFVLGCVLLALATRKMEVLRIEIAARPMRSFATGIVGSLAALVALIALCITVVGIPIAILGLLVAVFSVYSAICAVLTTFGAAVAGHRTKSPYIHLLIGCVAFLIVGSIPFVGGLATLALTMVAVGTLVSTRLAGVVVRRTPKPELT